MKNFLNKVKLHTFKIQFVIWFWYFNTSEKLRKKAEEFTYKMNDKL